jgi:hypothetical protein
MAYGNHSLYNGVPNFAHLFVSLQLGMNPRFEGQTRAQRQGDFTDNFNLPYKNLITFDTGVDSCLYNLFAQSKLCMLCRSCNPFNKFVLEFQHLILILCSLKFSYMVICSQIWASFFFRWLPTELHQRIGKKPSDYCTSNWHLFRVVFIQRSPNFQNYL